MLIQSVQKGLLEIQVFKSSVFISKLETKAFSHLATLSPRYHVYIYIYITFIYHDLIQVQFYHPNTDFDNNSAVSLNGCLRRLNFILLL